MVAATPKAPSTVSGRLERLSDDELALVGVLAVANRALTPSVWGSYAKVAGIRSTRMAQARQVAKLADRFTADDLVSKCNAGHEPDYFVPPAVAWAVLERLAAGKRLDTLAQRTAERSWHRGAEAVATQLRIAILRGETARCAQLAQWGEHAIRDGNFGPWLVETLDYNAGLDRLSGLDERTRHAFVTELLDQACSRLAPADERAIELALASTAKPLRLAAARVLVLRGDTERAVGLRGLPRRGREGLKLLHAFWTGNYAEAAAMGADVVASMTRRSHRALPDLEGLCHVLANFAESATQPGLLDASVEAIDVGIHLRNYGSAYATLAEILRALKGDRSELRPRIKMTRPRAARWSAAWVAVLHDLWLSPPVERNGKRSAKTQDERAKRVLSESAERARAQGFVGVAHELDAAAVALGASVRGRPADGRAALATTFRAPSAWEISVAGLTAIADEARVDTDPAGSYPRLVWEVTTYGGSVGVRARLRQSARARKGTVVSIARLVARDVDNLTEEDARVIATAESEPTEWYGSTTMVFTPRTVVALIDHPRVVNDQGAPVVVERGQVRLVTAQDDAGARVEIHPAQLATQDVWCETSGTGKILVFQRSAALGRIAEVLGSDGRLAVPSEGVQALTRALSHLCSRTEIEVEGDLKLKATRVPADPRPVLSMKWDGETLTVRASVAPLGLPGHARPGVGHPKMSLDRLEDGQLKLVECERDLAEERRQLEALNDRCPTLVSFAEGPLEARVTSLEAALDLIVEVQSLGDAVVVAWPEGRSLQVPVSRGLADLKLKVTSGVDWLRVDARVPTDEGTVLVFRELIAARQGVRFVALGRDRFLALSEQLRRRLDALHNLGTTDHDGLRITTAMLPVVDELAADLQDADFDAQTRDRLTRISELARARPRRPRRFGAQLRDYQQEGYAWMWRLAEAGLGACLADDMGLGKTVQALALLSQRASKGPALVVCPTSVVINWVDEANRFAPNLRPVLVAQADDRAATIASLGPRDVAICSYAMLVLEAQSLQAPRWATVAFDEAHALKNPQTRRAAVARALASDFRLALTGTPIENHVGELWSLFQVIVPGLLGTKARFDERFAQPIARGDRDRAAQLRRLLQHFVLRRTKSQVLDELPPRTEVTIVVPPTPRQRAYYQALRQQAVTNIEQGDRRKKRFKILAEITKLRRAAVDPRLVDPREGPPGSKLDALVERVDALRQEGHRVLVFTQFLGSMTMVCERLEAAGVEVLRLDGSTPAAERARLVEAFQAGQADAFVLSLRAGGVGMNLTGADYVIHLDPWWNPAVEDQASDRAHRIGQQRPVTVYRLIAEDTIEEKILALHETKRDLADDLLTGLQGGGALDIDELMELVSG